MKNLKNVVISKNSLNTLFENAASVYPKEACALLLGRQLKGNIEIKEAYNISNKKMSSYRFAINQSDLELALQKSKYKLVGIFHTHHHNTNPSDFDLENMTKKDLLWLIGYYKPTLIKSKNFKIDAYIMIKNTLHTLNLIINKKRR